MLSSLSENLTVLATLPICVSSLNNVLKHILALCSELSIILISVSINPGLTQLLRNFSTPNPLATALYHCLSINLPDRSSELIYSSSTTIFTSRNSHAQTITSKLSSFPQAIHSLYSIDVLSPDSCVALSHVKNVYTLHTFCLFPWCVQTYSILQILSTSEWCNSMYGLLFGFRLHLNSQLVPIFSTHTIAVFDSNVTCCLSSVLITISFFYTLLFRLISLEIFWFVPVSKAFFHHRFVPHIYPVELSSKVAGAFS